MENLRTLIRYNTDTYGSWDIGQEILPSTMSLVDVLTYATYKQAIVIVKPSRGKYWYIKGINGNRSYNDVKAHVECNVNNKYHEKSTLWLLSY